MTRTEFNAWLNDFRDRFPSTDEWLSRLPNQSALLNHWFAAMADVEQMDAINVTGMLLRGDIDEIKAYDREKIPAIVRHHAKRLANERRPTEEYSAPVEREFPVGSARGYLLQIEKLIAGGMAAHEAAEQVFPESDDSHHDTRRYSCPFCFDTGFVLCWNCEAVRKTLAGDAVTRAAGCDTFSVYCSCRKGQREGDRQWVRFDERKYCRVKHGDPIELVRWVEFKKTENRVTEFDDWNRRAPLEYGK